MAKKRSTTKSKSKVIKHRHFRPSYDAHPLFHLSTAILLVILLSLVLSYIVFGIQNPQLFR